MIETRNSDNDNLTILRQNKNIGIHNYYSGKPCEKRLKREDGIIFYVK